LLFLSRPYIAVRSRLRDSGSVDFSVSLWRGNDPLAEKLNETVVAGRVH